MRLSDALRSTADRAPIDGVQVNTADAAARAVRSRRLHAAANGTVGVGAVAVLGLGLWGVAPTSSSMSDEAMATADSALDTAAEESWDATAGEESMDLYSADGDTRLAEQWVCGSDFDPADGAWTYGDTSGVTFEAGAIETDGGEYTVPVTITASQPVDLIAGADYIITWDGLVVGSMVQPSPLAFGPADEPYLPDGSVFERLDPATEFSSLESWQLITPVNCWDGAALPAGTYEVHVAQTLAYPDDQANTLEPSVDEPSPAETIEPMGEAAGEGTDAALPAPSLGWEVFRVAADPVELTIEGEKVDDPFGEYLTPVEPLPGPTEEPGVDPSVDPVPLPEPTHTALPEGALTPEIVREMYAASEAGAWDMASGTSRWVINNPSENQYVSYGCAWGDDRFATFPATSSTMELLEIDVNAPSTVAVSYGFMVDGNPSVTASVTNVSPYDLYDFWGAQPTLHLVRNGVVVAEGWLTDVGGRGSGGTAAGMPEITIWPGPEGSVLDAGGTVKGQYVWRDVSRCDSADSGDVEPGFYTLLASTAVSVSNTPPMVAYDMPMEDGLVSPLEDLARTSEAVKPLPIDGDDVASPEVYDWVELQMWTSLGTITVSQ
ncbi:hypothetical protein ON058_00215 [Demequina sp. B12]|uniref:hypothetical protein n=1 Tax=Demequina sp. B12 TaxID=2992757 RepID=UPI00237C26C0|nr:hypothetical protein [Demequina sp. B12]MDE0571838.1 hypothetical protein [Demequina sp. B12]